MILEAIAVIQTANAAIGAVKELVGNGKDLMDCGKEMGEYFGAKSQLQQKANPNGTGNDLEAFLALRKLKAQEEELKNMMIYQGKPGMWQEWLEFQAQQKRNREAAKKEAEAKARKRKKLIKDIALGTALTLLILTGVGFVGYVMYWVATQ
jgi:hypothetical protein